MKAMVMLALLTMPGALPRPTNPAGTGPVYHAELGGPQRQYAHVDPYGDGSRVLVLGFYDPAGVFRFYPAENPHLYDRRPALYRGFGGAGMAGATVEADGSVNTGVVMGKARNAGTLATNSALGGEIFKEATAAESSERRPCPGPGPCPSPDDEDPDDGGTDDEDRPDVNRAKIELTTEEAVGGGAILCLITALLVARARARARAEV